MERRILGVQKYGKAKNISRQPLLNFPYPTLLYSPARSSGHDRRALLRWHTTVGVIVFLLASWLNLRADEVLVIINADDAGMCHSVNHATIKAMEQGVVSSASILVPCPAFEEFAAYAREHPEKDFGVHLALNSEWDTVRWGPVAPVEQVTSLVDQGGFLWQSVRDVVANAQLDEVEVELRAQINRARNAGIRLSHLDSHMYALGSRPDLLKLYVRLGIELGLPVLLVQHPSSRSLDRLGKDIWPTYFTAIEVLDRAGLPTPTFLDQDNYGIDAPRKREYFLNYFRNIRGGVTVIPIHCGIDNWELRTMTDSAPRRAADLRIFTSLEIQEELRRLRIRVINWRQFRERADGR